MTSQLTRRDFLKLSGISLGAAASLAMLPWPGDEERLGKPAGHARVTTRVIYRYREPDFRSERIGTLGRDQVVRFYEEIQSPAGPAHNPLWYRLGDGFAHSGYLQRVAYNLVDPPLPWLPENGRLGEISVPFTQSVRYTRTYGWVQLYRLYYGSIHWITGIDEGPDGRPWYALTDELLHVDYHVPAAHVRPIDPQEMSPIAPDVPARDKRIEVSIAEQTLTAFEGDRVALHTLVSTGIPGNEPTPKDIPTATPAGHFHVEVKIPSKHMGDGNLTNEIEAYELPGVPWVSFFHVTGVAFHGTYWHNNFGRMMSHGCVNMRTEEALWLYRWTLPTAEPDNWNTKGHGTYVRVV